MDIKGKVAIVTGGAGNIGTEIVTAFIENDCKGVTIIDIDEELGQTVISKLTNKFGDGKILFVKCDISTDKEFEDAFEKTIKTFGRVDILVNNAAYGNEKNYEKIIDINLTSTARGTYLGLKHFSKKNGNNGGTVLNISAGSGLVNYEYMPIYSSTKLAIVCMTACLGKPLYYKESGVAIICICPGYTISHKPGNLGKSLDKESQERLKNILSDVKGQPCSAVAQSAIYVIKHANSGSNWIIEEGNLYEANIPPPVTYRKLAVKDI